MAGLIQRTDPQLRAAQMLDDEPADDDHGLLVVPHGVMEHPAGCRSGVGSPAYSATVQPFLRGKSLINAATYLRACANGSPPGETRLQPGIQLGQGQRSPLTGYPGRRGRLRQFLRHNSMILRRLHLAPVTRRDTRPTWATPHTRTSTTVAAPLPQRVPGPVPAVNSQARGPR